MGVVGVRIFMLGCSTQMSVIISKLSNYSFLSFLVLVDLMGLRILMFGRSAQCLYSVMTSTLSNYSSLFHFVHTCFYKSGGSENIYV